MLVVSGLGPVGLLATLFGSRMGAEVVGIDPSADRRAFAEQLGARRTFDPTAGPIGEQVQGVLSAGRGQAVRGLGAGSAHAAIPDLLRPLGMAALVGLGNAELKMSLSAVVHREVVVFGTSAFPTTQYDGDLALSPPPRDCPEPGRDAPISARAGRRSISSRRHRDDGQGLLRLRRSLSSVRVAPPSATAIYVGR